ncbi:acyl carrier protein [Streptomyces tubercidicus]
MNSHADDALGGGDELLPLVSELWCEALGLPEVNPSDNFFDLGGHSLLLHTVRDRLHERLGRDIPLVELFQYPTVRALAEYLAAGATAGGAPGAGGASGALGGRLARLEARRGGRRTASGAGVRADQYREEEEAW